MQKNDLSFSIPTWRKEEIRSIDLAEEEALYIASPYNINDFKSQSPSIQYVFRNCSQPGSIQKQISKVFNDKLHKQVSIFVAFLQEIISQDLQIKQKCSIKQNQSAKPPENKQKYTNINLFKQKIYYLNLCQFQQVPTQFVIYYKNEILKKILFQYISKCIYNISLIEVLLLNNEMIRFVIKVLVSTVLLENNQIKQLNHNADFSTLAQAFLSYFADESNQNHKQSSLKIMTFTLNQVKGRYLRLKEMDDKNIYMFIIDQGSTKIQQKISGKQQVNGKNRNTDRFRRKSTQTNKQPQTDANKIQQKGEDKSQWWLCCLRLRR